MESNSKAPSRNSESSREDDEKKDLKNVQVVNSWYLHAKRVAIVALLSDGGTVQQQLRYSGGDLN